MIHRISHLDWPRNLSTLSAARLLGFAAALSLVGLILAHSGIDLDTLTPLKRGAVFMAGSVSACGITILILSMGFFWLRCDDSSKLSRNIWFGLLVLGFAYGTTVAYYLIVYLPTVRQRRYNPPVEAEIQEPLTLPRGLSKPHDRLGPFRRVLLIIWAIIAVPLLLSLALPGRLAPSAGWIMVPFFLVSALVLVESLVFGLVLFYFSGMNRPARSDAQPSPKPPTRAA